MKTIDYIKDWQSALQIEIQHLKKFGSTKYRVTNGHLLSTGESYSYYFDSSASLRIPVGSTVKVEWGSVKQEGRIMSSEGKSIILSLEKSIGDLIQEAFITHDPWELLDELSQRLDDVKKSKKKRARIKKLMDPSMESKHPEESVKGNIHEIYLRSKYNPVTFVWGPPGTGKTYSLAKVAIQHYLNGRKVLLLSHSNQAVDVLIEEIYNQLQKKDRFVEGDMIRYGSQVAERLTAYEGITTSQLIQKAEPLIAKEKGELIIERQALKKDLSSSFNKRDTERLLEIEKKMVRVLEKIRQKEGQLLHDAFIIGATLAKAASDETIYSKDYNVVLVDEASMAYIPQAAFAATLGKRLIICGDFKQLPPIASARHPLVEKWLKQDIFHSAGITSSVNDRELHPHLFLLQEQRRMHPHISAFTNQYIYHSLVSDHKSVKKNRNNIVEKAPFPNNASILVDTGYTGLHCITERSSRSRINLWQLLLSFQLIHESYVNGARSIGYATPYRAQAELMSLLLHDLYENELHHADIIAATVHRFQGSERDVMIFDSVDSYPQTRAGMLLVGKESERLINVAITRTRGKFMHVADTSFIREHVYANKTFRKLADFQQSQNQIVWPREIGKWVKNHHPKLTWMHAKKLESVFKDIDSASHSIIISFSVSELVPKDWKEKLQKRNPKVTLTVISKLEVEGLIADTWIMDSSIPFPFIIIDKQYLWLGTPFETAKGIKPPFVSVRLDSTQVAEQFIQQIPID